MSVGDMNPHSDGISVDDDGSATIDDTTISGNRVSVVGLEGQPVGFDPGMIVGNSPLVLRDSVIRAKSITATVGTSAEAARVAGLKPTAPPRS